MMTSDICPVTHRVLLPESITRPGRIIMNMLGELERYCPNKQDGCSWTGPNYSVEAHLRDCKCVKRESLQEEIARKNKRIEELEHQVSEYEDQIHTLTEHNDDLLDQVIILERKVKVYEAFFESGKELPDSESKRTDSHFSTQCSDALAISRLRQARSRLEGNA